MTINKDFSSAVVEDLVSRCVNTAEEGGDLGASIVEKLKEIFEISEKFAENNDDKVLRMFILKKLEECAKDEIDRSANANIKDDIKERSEKGAKKMMANEMGKHLQTDDPINNEMGLEGSGIIDRGADKLQIDWCVDGLPSLQKLPSAGNAATCAFAVGIVFEAIKLYSKERRKNKDYVDSAINVTKDTLSATAGTFTKKAVLEYLSVETSKTAIAAGGVVGSVVSCSISLTVDAVKRARGDISKIKQRKKMASRLGGNAGSILGGVGTTVTVMALVANPVGWAVTLGGIGAGVAGYVGGSFAGTTIDNAIWDETEDEAVEIYYYFGDSIKRRTRPIWSKWKILGRYEEKREIDEEGAQKGIIILLMVMFPSFKNLVKVQTEFENLMKSSCSDEGTRVSEIMHGCLWKILKSFEKENSI